MSAEQLKAVLEAIASAPALPVGATLEQTRAGVDAGMAKFAVADDLTFEAICIGAIPGLWSRHPAAGKRVILHLHGGGYVLGSTQGFRSFAGEIGRAAGANTLGIDYRLAPEHLCPAALEDAVAAWRWLLDQGHRPCDMAIAGDSAGGGLAVATLVALRDAGLPLPRAGLLVSPWVDLGCGAATMRSKADADPVLRAEALDYMAGCYLGPTPATSPQASPLLADLKGLPPLLIQVGSAEVLLDDAIRLAGAAGHADVPVALQIWPHMFHGWQSRQAVLDEGRDAIKAGGDFLRRQFDN